MYQRTHAAECIACAPAGRRVAETLGNDLQGLTSAMLMMSLVSDGKARLPTDTVVAMLRS